MGTIILLSMGLHGRSSSVDSKPLGLDENRVFDAFDGVAWHGRRYEKS